MSHADGRRRLPAQDCRAERAGLRVFRLEQALADRRRAGHQLIDLDEPEHQYHTLADPCRQAALKLRGLHQSDRRTMRVPIRKYSARPSRSPRKTTCEPRARRSEEHTSELQSLMRISYAVLCLKKKTRTIHKAVIYTIKPQQPLSS